MTGTDELVRTPSALSRGRATLSGAVAALAGLAAAELVGLVLPGRPGAVSYAADRVIAVTPAGPREAVIGAVGTLDKPLLVAVIVAVVVGGGALIGRGCAARTRLAPRWFAAGAALGFLVAWDGNTADLLGLLLLVSIGAVVASLVWTRLVRDAGTGDAADDDEAGDDVGDSDVDRRTVLRAAGAVALLSALGLGLAAAARRGSAHTVDAVRAALNLPRPSDPAPPVPAGVTPSVPGLAPAITPNADFYRIDVSLSPPIVDVNAWSVTVEGRVDRPLTLSYAELLAMPSIERHVTLTCVSNDVGGDLVGTARWQGVRLTDLLAKVGVHDDATLVLGRSVDGFTAGFPRQLLDDGRDAMVAYAMNGEPLPLEHGFPARLVVPGLYGYVSATKWLAAITLTTLEDDAPFWVARQWTADGRIEAASRIDVPREGATVAAGRVAVGGRAWHQHTGVGSVDVSVDDGPWQPATLAPALGVDTWRLWSWQWDATAGDHRLRVRMHDLDGTPQSAQERAVFPGASSGLHTVDVTVS